MANPDTLRYTRIPLTHGSGAIPAVGFGTLIPDPLATEQATTTALKVRFRHLDFAERHRNEEASSLPWFRSLAAFIEATGSVRRSGARRDHRGAVAEARLMRHRRFHVRHDRFS
jgi:hypothetical protein